MLNFDLLLFLLCLFVCFFGFDWVVKAFSPKMRVFIADLFDTNELFMFQHSSIPLAGRAGVILVSECVDFSWWKF